MFERIYLEISNICNLQCSFCPEVIREKKLISVDDFREYATQAQPLTKQICLHLMGEPMAHPQFSEIMDICDELGLRIFLTSNGTLLKKHAQKLLAWKALEQVNFSVHSYFANPIKMSLADYLKPILDFCDQAVEKQASFYINLRLWNLEKTNFQKDQNLQVFSILNPHYGLNLNENIDVKLNKSKKIVHKLYLHFDTEFVWPDLKLPVRGSEGSCYGLRKQLAVHANGDVVPCCLDKESVLKLGNINQNTLAEIMQTPKALKIKQGFERGELTEELCQKCQYADRFRKAAPHAATNSSGT
jgi:radical SAM protein with 4Fe4S-binding SPASM domain